MSAGDNQNPRAGSGNIKAAPIISPETKAKLDAFVKTTKESFEENGELALTCYLGSENGKSEILVCPRIDSSEDKDRFILECRMHALKIRAKYAMMAVEAWAVMLDKLTKEEAGEAIKTIQPSKHADREECVMCTFESYSGMAAGMGKIIRKDGEVKLGEIKMDWMDIEGRMCNILPPKSLVEKFEKMVQGYGNRS